MNKVFLLLLAYCTLAATGYAQTRDSIVTKQRLTQCKYISYKEDSSVTQTILLQYRYSGSRSSTFRPHASSTTFGFNYVRFPSVEEEPEYAHLPDPYNDAHKEDVAYDSVYDYQYGIDNDTFLLTKSRTHNDQLLLGQRDDYNNGDYMQSIIGREADGKIIHVQYFSNNKGNPYLYKNVTINYDNRGNIANDTIYRVSNDFTETSVYEHDDSGKVTSIKKASKTAKAAWQYTSWMQYQYSSPGRLSSRILWYMDNTGQWDTAEVNTFGYDVSGRLTSHHTGYYRSGYQSMQYVYHYNEAGDVDTVTRFEMDKKAYLIYYTYNDFHNPVFQYSSGVGLNGLPTGRWTTQAFTYELYDDTIKIPVAAIPMILYPNPAGSKITIRWNKDNPKRAVNISLYTATGQRARQYFINMPKAEDKLELSGLAAGVYMLEINSSTGGRIYRGSLVINGW